MYKSTAMYFLETIQNSPQHFHFPVMICYVPTPAPAEIIRRDLHEIQLSENEISSFLDDTF